MPCDTPGLDIANVPKSLLGLPLLCYVLYSSRKTRLETDHSDQNVDDLDHSIFDDIGVWYRSSSIVQLLTVPLLVCGAFISLMPSEKSTVFCDDSENKRKMLALQSLGLLLDATIAILAWRILAWARTTKARLKTLGSILLSSSVIIALFVLIPGILWYWRAGDIRIKELYGVDSLYFFDVFADSLTFAVFFISATLFTCESSPLILTGIITFICGLTAAFHKLRQFSSFEQLPHSIAVLPIYAMCLGFTLFMYRNNVRYIIFIHRAFISFLLLATVIGTTVYALVSKGVMNRHPLEQLIYETRVGADRWLVQASSSQSLPIAVQEYQERHHGRSPPPNFDVWYDYTTQRNSPIIDDFKQIESDILPFWGIKPSKIREEMAKLSSSRDIGFVRIRGRTVAHDSAVEPSNDAIMDDLVDLIAPFSQHLPDMDLPINLIDRPRVIASWMDKSRYEHTATSNKYDILHNQLVARDTDEPTTADSTAVDQLQKDGELLMEKLRGRDHSSPWDYQRQLGLACPPGSPARSGVYWNTRDFCSLCANPQAEDQFLTNMERSRDLCHQPDLFRLHGFYMSQMPLQPFTDIIPMFSRSKTDRFSDILIPLSRPSDTQKIAADEKSFVAKKNQLFWRGDVGQDFGAVLPRLLHGGHQERLSHMINNASASDQATLCLVTPGTRDKFAYERVPLPEVNFALPFDAGISDYSACVGPGCDEAKYEFGFKPEDKDGETRMNSRYVLLTDGDEGPPGDSLRIIRSTSVPFIASVFKEWYTERLIPWIHFVPIDIRWHGLHSTLAYFTGLKGRGNVNGRDVNMAVRIEEARWISEQGKKWADRAIRRHDAEIYMFRLLLEWGRVIDDKRDELGFVLTENSAKGREPWNTFDR